jgi:hypothetical protein
MQYRCQLQSLVSMLMTDELHNTVDHPPSRRRMVHWSPRFVGVLLFGLVEWLALARVRYFHFRRLPN